MENQKMIENPKEFEIFIYMLSKISSNHHRQPGFINAINQIILQFKDRIQKAFSNFKIFKLFKENKLIILFLLKHNIISFDQEIINEIIQKDSNGVRYCYFFYTDIHEILKSLNKIKVLIEIKSEMKNEYFEHFEEKREEGENDSYICQLIRNDSIDEFISYTTQACIPITKLRIKKSIFETNSFLLNLNEEPYLIEYAAFFGSIQIFKYLRINNAEIRPIIWLYAIHSNNAELIHFLEDIHINPPDNSYSVVLAEAIKCHHNDIANYIFNNLLDQKQTMNEKKTEEYSIDKNYVVSEICHFNYAMYTNEFKEYDELYYLFKINGDSIGKSYIQMKQSNNELMIPDRSVYSNCKELRGVIISPHETRIADNAFNQCTNLKEIIFLKNSSVKSIGQKAFYGCISLKTIELPITVSFIGEKAFGYCDKVHLKVSPPLFHKRVKYCFYHDIKSIEMLDYPSYVPKGAFRRCNLLSKIILPSSLTIIKGFAFKECLFLKSITLPEKVGIIGKCAFEICYNLEKVILVNPSSLKIIGNHAFRGCTILKEINYLPSVTMGIGVFDFCPYMQKKT